MPAMKKQKQKQERAIARQNQSPGQGMGVAGWHFTGITEGGTLWKAEESLSPPNVENIPSCPPVKGKKRLAMDVHDETGNAEMNTAAHSRKKPRSVHHRVSAASPNEILKSWHVEDIGLDPTSTLGAGHSEAPQASLRSDATIVPSPPPQLLGDGIPPWRRSAPLSAVYPVSDIGEQYSQSNAPSPLDEVPYEDDLAYQQPSWSSHFFLPPDSAYIEQQEAAPRNVPSPNAVHIPEQSSQLDCQTNMGPQFQPGKHCSASAASYPAGGTSPAGNWPWDAQLGQRATLSGIVDGLAEVPSLHSQVDMLAEIQKIRARAFLAELAPSVAVHRGDQAPILPKGFWDAVAEFVTSNDGGSLDEVDSAVRACRVHLTPAGTSLSSS
ncbi:uncharacterized protein B0H18DRAFT_1101750 [Fomitopsis serialis]|uniref:uncharacterized protein n=1 Tax=Fomitopsis serialis TaxID=139415 RepID=UPI002007F253|nr:uncharacterized protein B0H18DRAFT_1101750 [Neoantrodia serialis]KAH9934225.1 hypothetical protein B0H18DRAFT_1101750 [Neoantrodia serialis]